MALLSKLFMALASAAAVLAQGRIDSLYEVDQSLRGHTVYRPRNMTAYAKMPVVVWGNGACSANGLSHVNFNLEVAAWGIILIAQGEPNQSGSTNSNQMKQAIDWISSNAGKGNYANVDASRIAAAGMSCGGTEAYAMVPDSRVKAYGIFNSGNLDEGSTNRIMPQINVPIFFFLGGPSDIAYNNGMRDYRAVRSGVPTWVGNLPVGHGGTYGDPRGGKFGTAGQQFFRWALRGDTSASGFFTGGGAQADGWTTESKNLGNLNASPLPTGTSAPTNVPTTAPTTAPNPTTTAAPQPTGNCAAKWGQCGGQGWSGSTCCAEGTCTKTNDWYSQCV